jgi:hypothetical protein
MQPKWPYGDAWEQFPIELGEVWGISANESRVAVHDLFEPLPEFMKCADMLFVDPPWNQGNVNTFYTKAGRTDYINNFTDFEKAFFRRVKDINPVTCYIEIGFQAVDKWQALLSETYPVVQKWDVVYYRKHPCHILRGSRSAPLDFDYTGMDESKVIAKAGEIEQYSVLGDICMGRGLVGMAAFSAGKPFVGTELNKRRLACLLQKLHKKGAEVKKYE